MSKEDKETLTSGESKGVNRLMAAVNLSFSFRTHQSCVGIIMFGQAFGDHTMVPQVNDQWIPKAYEHLDNESKE